ncbi:unnamed protein product, partial [Polarella glacialis]
DGTLRKDAFGVGVEEFSEVVSSQASEDMQQTALLAAAPGVAAEEELSVWADRSPVAPPQGPFRGTGEAIPRSLEARAADGASDGGSEAEDGTVDEALEPRGGPGHHVQPWDRERPGSSGTDSKQGLGARTGREAPPGVPEAPVPGPNSSQPGLGYKPVPPEVEPADAFSHAQAPEASAAGASESQRQPK